MIEWKDIDLKGKTSGQIKTICPTCSPDRKNKNDLCLSVNIDEGVAKCHHCEDIATKNKRKEKKETVLPPQEWSNFTSLSDGMVKWFKEERNISQNTLIECKITEEKFYQPAHEKEVNNIVFNYFEGNTLVNKKYRSGAKKFTQTKNAKKVFYGINDVIGEEEIYIVEGEMDKLAFWEIGIKNCISVPNGANDLNDIFDTCGDYIKNAKTIHIAVDSDEPGKKLEDNLIKRFGKWRCDRISFGEYKDANDALVADKIQFMDYVKNPIEYPVDNTYSTKDVADEVFDLYDNGMMEAIYPKSDTFSELNKVFKIYMGQLTTVTGVPSHGKSNFIEFYCLNLVNDYNFKMSMFSPEHHPLKLHHSVMAEKVIGKPFDKNYEFAGDYVQRMTKTELNAYLEWASNKIYLTYPDKDTRIDWETLLDIFREQLFRYGIDIFVIDAFNKVKRNKPDSLGEISDILSMLTSFCQAHNVHIFLIAHPTKMPTEDDGTHKIPNLYSVKGSGDFRDQTHNGLVVHRYFLDDPYVLVRNLKTKFKQQGEIGGEAEFKFDHANNRYYKRIGGYKDRFCLFHDIQQQSTFLRPDDNEDVPF